MTWVMGINTIGMAGNETFGGEHDVVYTGAEIYYKPLLPQFKKLK